MEKVIKFKGKVQVGSKVVVISKLSDTKKDLIKKVKELNGGFLSLSDALKTGLGIALISGLISVIYTYIFTTIIEPDFFINLAQIQEQKLIDAGMTDEQIETQLGLMAKMSGPMITSAFAIIGSLFFGFIISLIAGLIMKESKE